MRYRLLPLAMFLLASSVPFCTADAQPPPGPPPGYAGPPAGPGGPPPPPRYRMHSDDPAYSTENCGTPDEPRSCPPMPRHPLPYFPENRHQ